MQAARKLHRRSFREREQRFLAEGASVVTEALTSEATVLDVFVDDSVAVPTELERAARAADIPLQPVTPPVAAALSSTATPQGIVAVVGMQVAGPDALGDPPSLVVVLAGVRDPGNAGTLVRSATAAAVDGVVFAEGTVDPYNPKVVRSSAGTLFHTTVVTGVPVAGALERLRASGVTIVGTEAHGETDVYTADLATPTAVVLGNETWGVGDEVAHLIDLSVTIPMPGPAESLNVGIAGSLILFEALRQRRIAGETRPSGQVSSAPS